MSKIVLYVDWTDCVAHLATEYAEGETPTEKSEYTAKQAKNFFAQIKQLQDKGFEVECHVISGGSVEMLSEMFEQICELAENSGFPNLFKSLTCEYGGDIVTKDGIIEVPNPDSERLFTKSLQDSASASLSDIPDVYFRRDKYLQNIRFENINITEQEFNTNCARVEEIYGHKDFNFYSYFCPGYGVEIDICPKSLNKYNAVRRINAAFYAQTPRSEIVLSIFNGDFPQIDLPMVNASLTSDVLFVGTEEGEILSQTTGTSLPTSVKGRKLESLTLALQEVCSKDLSLHPYDKGDYEYGRSL